MEHNTSDNGPMAVVPRILGKWSAFDEDSTIFVMILLVALAAYLFFPKLQFPGETKTFSYDVPKAEESASGESRSIAAKMAATGKNCVIFVGSQTGTGEAFARRLAKEAKSRFGLDALVADLEDYDLNDLDSLPSGSIAMFVLSTYGEGEPTDNATEFWKLITGNDVEFSRDEDPALGSLQYTMFGLGNRTYEHFNAMARRVSAILDSKGAQRLGPVGEGDDGAGTTEEDYLAWKEDMWTALCAERGIEERDVPYESAFAVMEQEIGSEIAVSARNHLYDSQSTHLANITQSYELLNSKDRNCVHMELNIEGSSISYQTGDHVAVWPVNPSKEVLKFFNVLGLSAKEDVVVNIRALDPSTKVPFPTPATFRTILESYLEICGPVSRQFLSLLAAFAPDETSKTELTKLSNSKEYFRDRVTTPMYNLADVLNQTSQGKPWSQIPFSALIEGIPTLKPRYYSISSSSLVQPDTISITAMVESHKTVGRSDTFKGVASNYLLAKSIVEHGKPSSVPIHVRKSTFHLPSNISEPIILVGPGTGVAPFRAFLHERTQQARQGQKVGQIMLFIGCRRRDEDFLYSDEWQQCQSVLGDKLKIITAFSRETSQKVYVQHRLYENTEQVAVLLRQGAHIYICGDAANMARSVTDAFVHILTQTNNPTGSTTIEGLRAANRFHEDVW